MPETPKDPNRESKENPDFRVNITVHRHGPKEGLAGDLSEEGKDTTRRFFHNECRHVPPDIESTDIEYSPIDRAEETAKIFGQTIRSRNLQEISSFKEDNRLSEGGVAKHEDVIKEYGGRGGKWIKGWMEAQERPKPDVNTGREAAADFADWLLSKIEQGRDSGEEEVDAFSHGPVLLSFLLLLEDKLNKNILPEDWKENDIFDSELNYLSSVNFSINSNHSDTLDMRFNREQFKIPLSDLKDISNNLSS